MIRLPPRPPRDLSRVQRAFTAPLVAAGGVCLAALASGPRFLGGAGPGRIALLLAAAAVVSAVTGGALLPRRPRPLAAVAVGAAAAAAAALLYWRLASQRPDLSPAPLLAAPVLLAACAGAALGGASLRALLSRS
ncbi:MAG: hypothetical protein D6718_02745 [Acidobacteria bacterium]|nr:MAG: hypothetical protein D6718_02745 [Acidobacteriota bacterium]